MTKKEFNTKLDNIVHDNYCNSVVVGEVMSCQGCGCQVRSEHQYRKGTCCEKTWKKMKGL